MRIIAGALKGRRVRFKDEPGVRPISGRIKQSLFDILKGLLPGARVLDLFAGTGAVGLEALSRGASFVFFVDLNRRCVATVTDSLAKTGLSERGKAQQGNALSDLSWIAFRSGVDRFDVIFLGPPYRDEEKRPLAYTTPALARVAESGLLAPGGIVVAQHHVKEAVSAPAALAAFKRAKCGDTFLDFFRAAEKGAA